MSVSIVLTGLDSDFRADTGEGTQRYGYELYRHLRKIGVEVKKRTYNSRLQYASHTLSDYYGDSDIVHIPNFRLLYPIRKGKAITLVTAHDFQPLINPEIDVNHDATPSNMLWFELVKLGLRRVLASDYLICNSTLTKQDAISLGYDRNRVFVANHGIDERFRRREKVGKKGKEFKVGYLGGFRSRKNVSFAIKAFREIKRPGIVFELWGKTSFEYNYLTDLAKSDRRIRFMGFAPEDKIVDIYDTFDAFVFPSLYEGEGLPILEAQSRGLPVVVYKNARIPDEIRKYCFEADNQRHMAQILQDIKRDGYNDKLRKIATAYARGFTWNRLARETANVYKKIKQ